MMSPLTHMFCFYKWSFACLRTFNVQSICSLAHIKEMSRSIIYTCTGQMIWQSDGNDWSGAEVYLSRRYLTWCKNNTHKAVCVHHLSFPISWIIEHPNPKKLKTCSFRRRSLWPVIIMLQTSQTPLIHVMACEFEVVFNCASIFTPRFYHLL